MPVEEFQYTEPHTEPAGNGDATKPGENDYPTPVTFEDIQQAPRQKPPVAIDGLLYHGGKAIFIGASKARKTWLMLDLAISIAAGGEWLGHRCNRGGVLYLDLELMPWETGERATKIANARNLNPGENLHLWNLRGYHCELAKIRRPIIEHCRANKIRALVVDPWYKLAAGAEQNSNDEVARVLSEIENLCRQADVSFIFSHHSAKGDGSKKAAIDLGSGAGVFARDPDLIATIRETSESTNDQPRARMELIARSFPPPADKILKWNFPVWELDPLGSAELASPGRKVEYPLAEIVGALTPEPMTTAEWKAAAREIYPDLSDSTFKRRMEEAKRRGIIKPGPRRNRAQTHCRLKIEN